jgi:hypothetical protein
MFIDLHYLHNAEVIFAVHGNSSIYCLSYKFCTTESSYLNDVSFKCIGTVNKNSVTVAVLLIELVRKPRNTISKLLLLNSSYRTKDIRAFNSVGGLRTKKNYLCKCYTIGPEPISLRNVFLRII